MLALPDSQHQDKLSSPALSRPPNATVCRRQGQRSCSHALWQFTRTQTSKASSAVLPSSGARPTLPSAAACEGLGQLSPLTPSHSRPHRQGQLHRVAQVRGRVHSLEHAASEGQNQLTHSRDPEAALHTATDGEGQEDITPHHLMAEG